MIEKGKISVIMPVYNTEKYLKAAIKSILNQTYKNFELIIVDDNSTDNSYKIAENFAKKDKRIKLVKNKNKKGISGGVNTGIELSTGEYITRMDSDDISLPDRFKKQYDFLQKNKKYNSCSVNLYYIDKKGKRISNSIAKKHKAPYEWLLIAKDPLPNAPIFYSNKIIKENNLKYDYDFKTSEDYNFLKDYILHGGKITLVNEPLYEYRFHNGSITLNNYNLTFANSLIVIENYIKSISKQKIHKDFFYVTDYKEYKNKGSHIDLKGVIEYLESLLKEFSKKYKWTEEEIKEANNAIYDMIEESLIRKRIGYHGFCPKETIIGRCIRILKNEGFKGFTKKLYRKLFGKVTFDQENME